MKLALFFTRGVSLKNWLESGLFDREKLIYEKHLADGTLTQVFWFTYGSHDADVAEKLYSENRLDRRIVVWPMPRIFSLPKLGSWVYSLLAPWIYRNKISEVDVLKTNQLDGCWAAVISKWLFSKPLVLRCGYVQSKLETTLKRVSNLRLILMMRAEKWAYQIADAAIVASYHNERYVRETYGISSSHLCVIPNYLDVDRFTPLQGTDISVDNRRLLFVGRLSHEKNLINLAWAAHRAGIGLDLVGNGPQFEELKSLAVSSGMDVRLLGSVSNNELPSVIARYRYFALPSLFEGMPKTLLEAMACGLVCIGTDVDGINEIVVDGINGYLAKSTDADSICEAIIRATSNHSEEMSRAARETVLGRYTLSACAELERDLLLSIWHQNSDQVQAGNTKL